MLHDFNFCCPPFSPKEDAVDMGVVLKEHATGALTTARDELMVQRITYIDCSSLLTPSMHPPGQSLIFTNPSKFD